MTRRRIEPTTGSLGDYSLSSSRLDYERAQRIIINLQLRNRNIPGTPLTGFSANEIETLFGGLPATYETIVFLLVAPAEHTPLFASLVRNPDLRIGVDLDGEDRPVLGFGYDLHANRGTFYQTLLSAGIQIPNNSNLRALLQKFGPSSTLDEARQLRIALNNAGFTIGYADAVKLFTDYVVPGEDSALSDVFQRRGSISVPQSIERAILLDTKFSAQLSADTASPARAFFDAALNGQFVEAALLQGFAGAARVATSDYEARLALRAEFYIRFALSDRNTAYGSAQELARALNLHTATVGNYILCVTRREVAFPNQSRHNVRAACRQSDRSHLA